MANDTRGKVDQGLDLFAIFDDFADVEDSETLCNSQIDCVVCKDASRTYAATKTKSNIVWIGFWFVP